MSFLLTINTFDGGLNAECATETQARELARILKDSDEVHAVVIDEFKHGRTGKRVYTWQRTAMS